MYPGCPNYGHLIPFSLHQLTYLVHPDQQAALRRWIGSTPVLVYDGPCPLCNRVVKFLLWADTKQRLLYTTQQMDAGQALLRYYDLGLTKVDDQQDQAIQPTLTNEVWLATDGRLYTGADAALQTLISIGGFWALMGRVGLWFPTRFRDWVYAWISRNRYDLLSPFACELPNHKRLQFPPAS